MKTDLEKYWQAYCKGDKSAFEKVFILMFDPLFFKVMFLTKDRDAAKDIVQETLIRLFQFEEPSQIKDIKNWTYKVAKHLFISEYRKVQTRRNFQQTIQSDGTASSSAPTSFPDEENFNKVAKKHLSASDFQLLQLDMQGYPIQEIAEILEVQEKTVYNRRTEIRKVISKVWKQVFVLVILFYL